MINKSIITTISIFLFVVQCQAQVELGARFGFNNTSPSGSEFSNINNATSDFGLDAGLVAQFPLGNNGLFLTTGLGFYKSSFSSDSKDPLLNGNPGWFFDLNENYIYDFDEPGAAWGDLYYHRDYSLSSFNLPLGLMYKLIGKKLNLYFELGTDFSYISKGSVNLDLKDVDGNTSSPTSLFYTESESTSSYLDFYKNNDAASFNDFGGHIKQTLYYAEDLTFGSGGENYFNNLLISAYVGMGIYIDLFHGDIYLGANYHHGVSSFANNNAVDINRPSGMNRVVASIKYSFDLVL